MNDNDIRVSENFYLKLTEKLDKVISLLELVIQLQYKNEQKQQEFREYVKENIDMTFYKIDYIDRMIYNRRI